MNVRWTACLSGMALIAAAVWAQGQDAARSPYFDCPYVNYFDRDCPQLRERADEAARHRPRGRESPDAAPAERQPVSPPEPAGREHDGQHEPDAGETYLLFPRESLAPDAPPLFRRLLAEPSIENARRYVRWYARRAARLQAVQALIRSAGRELESELE